MKKVMVLLGVTLVSGLILTIAQEAQAQETSGNIILLRSRRGGSRSSNRGSRSGSKSGFGSSKGHHSDSDSGKSFKSEGGSSKSYKSSSDHDNDISSSSSHSWGANSDSSSKSSSSQSRSDSQSSSSNSSSKSKSDTNSGYTKPQMSSPELNESERSNFQSGAKVSDDETLKKYSKQNDDFSDEQAKSIFDNNDDYQTRDRYYRQDVIRNPWFWMYMSRRSYHRYGNSYHSKVNNNAYTKGYQDGFADSEKGIDNYDSYSKESTLLGKFTTTSEKTAYLRGYKDGHDDGK